MNVLVTGGTGFLGKNLQKISEDSGINLIIPSSSECDWLSAQSVETYTESNLKSPPDVILHMAASCGGILANKNTPASFLRDNTQMGLNVYEYARQKGIKMVYSLGSVCSYPVNCPSPFKEDDIWNGKPEDTNMPYGQAKRNLMVLSQTYRQEYGIGGAHLIPVNMYGKFDHFDLIKSHVIPALIRKFVTAVENNLPIVECWGTGAATREFLYAEDCAKAILLAIKNKFDYDQPVNLGVGKDISIKDLALMIKSLTGFRGDVIFTGAVSDGQPKRLLDVSRAKKLLNWEAETSLENGLIQIIDWYKSNRPET